ncbi:hypothetical protein Bpfe_003367 [Biomphalaria pfeifferi]|uniref:Uncharacterized protein n=1 Tax=Biomphalaria pfeifferi TaxID=112525 RepID=A0AAD8C807_BIOPF|nr:hypothetical protein Bpfe_003367 [Biomphalaria pfeifferi]
MTMSIATEPSSSETITSRVSIVICEKDYADEKSRSSASLNFYNRNPGTQPLTGGENIERNYSSSPNYLPLACFALMLNPILGIPALICSYLSKKYRRLGSSARSSKYSGLALWLSIVAIATAIVFIVFVCVYIFVITPNIIRSIQGFSLDNENMDLALEVSSITSIQSL